MLGARRLLIGIPLLAAIVVVAAAAGWWTFIREDAELATSAPEVPSDLQPTQAPGAEATADAPSIPEGVELFQVIPERSEAAYFADEKLARLSLPSTAKGVTNEIEGSFYLTDGGTALAVEPVSTFSVNVASISSDEGMRDSRMREALEVTQFPTATFTATEVTGYDPSIAEGQEQSLQLNGTLELHGVTRDITWDVKARREGDVFTALATVNFRYEDFDIPVLNIGGFVTVEEDVTLQIQIVARRVG